MGLKSNFPFFFFKKQVGGMTFLEGEEIVSLIWIISQIVPLGLTLWILDHILYMLGGQQPLQAMTR